MSAEQLVISFGENARAEIVYEFIMNVSFKQILPLWSFLKNFGKLEEYRKNEIASIAHVASKASKNIES